MAEANGVRRAGDRAHDDLQECVLTPEQNLALVGEVPEERAVGSHRPTP
jgi:hypothetical protein